MTDNCKNITINVCTACTDDNLVDLGDSHAEEAVIEHPIVKIQEITVTDDYKAEFRDIPSGFNHYQLVIDSVTLENKDQHLRLKCSTDAGNSFEGNDFYQIATQSVTPELSQPFRDIGTAGHIQITSQTLTEEESCGYGCDIKILGADVENKGTIFLGQIGDYRFNQVLTTSFSASFIKPAIVNGLQISSSFGNILQGRFTLYGIR